MSGPEVAMVVILSICGYAIGGLVSGCGVMAKLDRRRDSSAEDDAKVAWLAAIVWPVVLPFLLVDWSATAMKWLASGVPVAARMVRELLPAKKQPQIPTATARKVDP